MKPPTSGPITGPIRAGTVSQAIAVTMSALATERSRTSRPTGAIIAPPRPWSRRAATSSRQGIAQAARDRAREEHDDGAAEDVLAPNRSATQPLIGMNTARLNR